MKPKHLIFSLETSRSRSHFLVTPDNEKVPIFVISIHCPAPTNCHLLLVVDSSLLLSVGFLCYTIRSISHTVNLDYSCFTMVPLL